jgi:cytochrome c1
MRYQDELDAAALRRYAVAMNQRAKAHNAAGRVTPDMLQTRIFESAGRCEWCGCSVVGADFEVDHIISIMRGGDNTPANLAIACPDCNRRKSGKHPATFAQEIIQHSGTVTPLAGRVLAYYDMPAQRQPSLFAADTPEHPTNDKRDAETHDTIATEQDDNPPPYRW